MIGNLESSQVYSGACSQIYTKADKIIKNYAWNLFQNGNEQKVCFKAAETMVIIALQILGYDMQYRIQGFASNPLLDPKQSQTYGDRFIEVLEAKELVASSQNSSRASYLNKTSQFGVALLIGAFVIGIAPSAFVAAQMIGGYKLSTILAGTVGLVAIAILVENARSVRASIEEEEATREARKEAIEEAKKKLTNFDYDKALDNFAEVIAIKWTIERINSLKERQSIKGEDRKKPFCWFWMVDVTDKQGKFHKEFSEVDIWKEFDKAVRTSHGSANFGKPTVNTIYDAVTVNTIYVQ